MIGKKEKTTAIVIIGLVLLATILWYFGVWSYILPKPPEEKINPELLKKTGPVDVMVYLVSTPNPVVVGQLEEVGLEVRFKFSNWVSGTIDASKLKELAEIPQVVYIDMIRESYEVKHSPLSMVRDHIKTPGDVTGKGITIAVIDGGNIGGIDCKDLRDINPGWTGTCIQKECDDVSCAEPSTIVGRSHALGVGEIITFLAPDVNIVSYAVFDPCDEKYNTSTDRSVCRTIALELAVNDIKATDIKIISMSLGWFTPGATTMDCKSSNQPEKTMISAYDSGILPVVAAGNCGSGDPDPRCGSFRSITSPACVPGKVLAVGSVSISNAWSPFSSEGPSYYEGRQYDKPDVVGVGEDVLLMAYGNASTSGTSFSTPEVSAVSALILEANGALSPSQVFNTIITSTVDICDTGFDYKCGNGLVQADEAVNKARTFGIISAIPNLFK